MLGRTHLLFGVATTTTAIAVGHIGLSASAIHHYGVTFNGSTHSVAWPSLRPAAWLALVAAAGLGSLLPDIDQPGSLVTRMPANQARALRRAGAHYAPGAIGAPARATIGMVGAGGDLATAMLGGEATGYSSSFRILLALLALLAAALFSLMRWLPPQQLLAWPVEARHLIALALGGIALVAALLAIGGLAGLVNRLPGHHRGWTHAPPVAAGLLIASMLLAPSLFPVLPDVGAAFGLGYISHLIADALTIRGIPLLMPGQHQPSLHLLPPGLRVRTGSAGEGAFNVIWPPLLVIVAVFLLR